MIEADLLTRIVARASLAPSVHNVQPTRWSLDGEGRILLLDTPAIRLPVADPSGRDIAISHGAALEGTLLALAAEGWAGQVGQAEGALAAICATPDTPAALPEVESRATWRGSFAPLPDPSALDRLEAECADLMLVRGREAIAHVASFGDDASMHFLRDDAHRRELREWMRLTRAHPNWAHDGLNAEAMALSPIEARAAGLVLGALFQPLDRIGLARTLLSERAKTASAAAIALFVRPADESAIDTGRAFYRAWLAIERHGLAACPMSVLADWDETNRLLAADHRMPAGQALISVFRIGPRPCPATARRARWAPHQLIRVGLT
ncbi:hypothetical protein OK349_04830 [Sphingomonas sp. BT-65]|uniref:hypothetical protein n=1 Tax=Sphingomonas sp. BT-65 TaxID=2989821 RepID=UPI0022360269|nr:hypothetical protein [Sphingomonas sp. BT-65]MCW4461022.1 hypothetical protein [Sphingomonas sp. BT-65]